MFYSQISLNAEKSIHIGLPDVFSLFTIAPVPPAAGNKFNDSDQLFRPELHAILNL
jgi:hypothetical protein